MKRPALLLLIMAVLSISAFTPDKEVQPGFIPPSRQRTGDPSRGYQYLVTGDYLKSGIPYAMFLFANRKDTNNYLGRDGLNKNLSYSYTAVKAPNGELVVAPNCLACHAQMFDGKLIVGLGNALSDFTMNQQGNALMLEKMLQKDPKKLAAARNFITSLKAISPSLRINTRGLNLADALAALLVAHRNPQTLAWSDSALLQLPASIVPTDVPAWWLLKKKNAMFYNGFGRGDFGRFLMASNLLTVSDTAEAVEVDAHFNDVLAYIQSIEAPKYPGRIDAKQAGKGKTLFNDNCSACHGTYGKDGKYPNLLIPESIIGTDSLLYASNYSSPQFVDWFNRSWFTTGDHPAALVPYRGYIAPPLDGIWITAPYFHNGSVPNLEAVLNSRLRPRYWQRDFTRQDYNLIVPGWNYVLKESAESSDVYNTTAAGYGAYGHYFGDVLTDIERKAVIEYLKTL